jgi:hypothetical protein
MRVALGLGDDERAAVALTPDQLAACVGRFGGDGYAREVFAVNGGLAFAEHGAPGLQPFSTTGFWQADDPEVEYRFSDLRDGRYQRLSHASPLWPDNSLVRLNLA